MDILLMLAVLPAAILLWYVWQKDPIEKEPPGLLLKLLVFGMLSTIPAGIIEMFGASYFGDFDSYAIGGGFGPGNGPRIDYDALTSLVLQYFVGVALVEEGCKLFFLKWQTWRHPAFDYVFDGIVYAVFVGLGFAIAENINYVFTYGFSTGVVRAFTAIPGHCVFAVFMGYFYGKAKFDQVAGKRGRMVLNGACAIVVPVFCHGTYDTLASIEGDAASMLFYLFLIIIVALGMHLVNRASAQALRIR